MRYDGPINDGGSATGPGIRGRLFTLRGAMILTIALTVLVYLALADVSFSFRWLLFGVLLLCPLLHVFMHRGHGGGGGQH